MLPDKHPTIKEAKRLCTDQAFKCTDKELTDSYGRELIHVRGSFTGADWDLETVLKMLDDAEAVHWVDDFFGHHLEVVGTARGGSGPRRWRLQIKPPVEATS